MSLYVVIDESYHVSKLNGIADVMRACANYYTRDGQVITKALAKSELKSGAMNVYSYDEEELETARERGSVIGVDWLYKIQSI